MWKKRGEARVPFGNEGRTRGHSLLSLAYCLVFLAYAEHRCRLRSQVSDKEDLV